MTWTDAEGLHWTEPRSTRLQRSCVVAHSARSFAIFFALASAATAAEFLHEPWVSWACTSSVVLLCSQSRLAANPMSRRKRCYEFSRASCIHATRRWLVAEYFSAYRSTVLAIVTSSWQIQSNCSAVETKQLLILWILSLLQKWRN